MRVAAVVLAAGQGTRLGAKTPKAFVSVAGKTLLERSVETLSGADEVDWVQPVIPAELIGPPAAPSPSASVAAAVPGGARRQDSVAAGLDALPEDVTWVAVHDAARCLVSREEVDQVVLSARRWDAAILARPSPDTLKLVEDGVIRSTPERSACWIAQTPQVFRVDLLREGLAKARAEHLTATDDAQLVEWLGVRVRVVEGSALNMKITHPVDLVIAEALVERDRALLGAAS